MRSPPWSAEPSKETAPAGDGQSLRLWSELDFPPPPTSLRRVRRGWRCWSVLMSNSRDRLRCRTPIAFRSCSTGTRWSCLSPASSLAWVSPEAVVDGARVEAFGRVPGAKVGPGTWVQAGAAGGGVQRLADAARGQDVTLGTASVEPGRCRGCRGLGCPGPDGHLKIPRSAGSCSAMTSRWGQ